MFKMLRLAVVCGLMLGLAQESRATLVTFDFTGSEASGSTLVYYGAVGGVIGTDYSLIVSSMGIASYSYASQVNATLTGLGSNSGTSDCGSIFTVDSRIITTGDSGSSMNSEALRFDLNKAVDLVSITFAYADAADRAWVGPAAGYSDLFFSGYTINADGTLTVAIADGLASDDSYMAAAMGPNSDWQVASMTFEAGDSDPTVPEPATLGLVSLGLAGFGVMRRRRAA